MSETGRPELETSTEIPEYIPGQAEVREIFSDFSGARALEFRQPLVDEQGNMYLWEAVIAEEALDASTLQSTELSYARKGAYPDGNRSTTTMINVVYYEDGVPVGGKTVAELIDNQWRRYF